MVPDRQLRGYWLLIAALGIAVFWLSSKGVQGQAEPAQGEAETEQEPPQTLPIPFPVYVVEDDAKSDARERSEAESEEREIRDLAAQEGMNAATQAMNAATQDMARIAQSQTDAVWLGTFLVFGTLLLALQANKAARDAVRVTRQIGERQVRAYVHPSFVGFFTAEELEVDGLDEGFTAIAVQITNYGQSPARRVQATMAAEVWKFPPPEKNRKPIPITEFADDRMDMPPGGEQENRIDRLLSPEEREAIESGICALYVFGRIRYFDVFDQERFTNFLLYSKGDAFVAGNFRTHSFGNEAN